MRTGTFSGEGHLVSFSSPIYAESETAFLVDIPVDFDFADRVWVPKNRLVQEGPRFILRLVRS